jgi:formylglycine-generating enzyme required for sulfatase activity
MEAAQGSQAPLSVFISYSRKDNEAAERLRAGLIAREMDAYLDTHDILAGEDWQGRIGQLIARADSVVFLISPDSVASRICDWEVNETERLSKRLLPVVVRDADQETVPGRLKRLNYIFLRNADEEAHGLNALHSALNTDIGWVREHTRLGKLAGAWLASGRRGDGLLRGAALIDAERWISSRPREAPEPSDLHREFIQASRKGELAALEKERSKLLVMKRWLQASLVLLGVSIVGLIAWLNQGRLTEQIQWYSKMKPTVTSAAQEADLIAKPGSQFTECEHGCPDMVVVPAGQFLMGAEPPLLPSQATAVPRHKVSIARPFAVAKTPVTFAQWQLCVDAMACPAVEDTLMNHKDQPVIAVDWDQAKQYAAWLARVTGKPYRLLSEAEFEYAARGTTDVSGPYTAYSWGDSLGQNNATCLGCGSQWDNKGTAPVATFKPNAFGLYDMNGNAFQWLEDTWHETYDGAPADGSAWTVGPDPKSKVKRGGSFRDDPESLRPEIRYWGTNTFRYENLGLRVARSLISASH